MIQQSERGAMLRWEDTMSEFRLRIELGNEAMKTVEDVAEALCRVAKHLEARDGGIIDVNGNMVGDFEWSQQSHRETRRRET